MQFLVPDTCLSQTKLFRHITTAFTTSTPATIIVSTIRSSSNSSNSNSGSSSSSSSSSSGGGGSSSSSSTLQVPLVITHLKRNWKYVIRCAITLYKYSN